MAAPYACQLCAKPLRRAEGYRRHFAVCTKKRPRIDSPRDYPDVVAGLGPIETEYLDRQPDSTDDGRENDWDLLFPVPSSHEAGVQHLQSLRVADGPPRGDDSDHVGDSEGEREPPVICGDPRTRDLSQDVTAGNEGLHDESDAEIDSDAATEPSRLTGTATAGTGRSQRSGRTLISPSKTYSRGKLSIDTAFVEEKLYNHETKRRAGHKLEPVSYAEVDNHMRQPVSTPEASSSSGYFTSEFDEAFGRWLFETKVSARAVDRLLEDPRLAPLHEQLSWTTYRALRKRYQQTGSKLSREAGKWLSATQPYTSLGSGFVAKPYKLRYRNILEVIRFFLGNDAFRNDLIFAPRRIEVRDSEDDPPRRVFSSIDTADHWWDLQDQIEADDATVVPLIVASDKTQVTNHQGDMSVHAVYLTIGNLPAHIRNSNTRPGCLLVAMLPMPAGGSLVERNQFFHNCMRTIFEPIETISRTVGVRINCADGWVRHCFPILSVMALDYQEQVTVTGVKNNVHCTTCTIEPNRREDLGETAQWRSHEHTQRQLMHQREFNVKASHPEYLHDVDSFAFYLPLVNTHKIMMADTLHQLLKGVLMHTLRWLHTLVETLAQTEHPRVQSIIALGYKHDAKKKKKQKKMTASKAIVEAVVDRRFAAVSPYPGLRTFRELSRVSQWTGEEQKSIAKQLLPAFAPLLEEVGAPEAIAFIRATVDFILLAMYRSHDCDTMRYMYLALARMNAHKEVFRKYRPEAKDPVTGEYEGHFNFAKWHAITHYVELIMLFGNVSELETGHFEHKHVDEIKTFFQNTNKKAGWEDQLGEKNSQSFNIKTQFDLGGLIRPLTMMEQAERVDPPVVPTEKVELSKYFPGMPLRAKGHGSTCALDEVERFLPHNLGRGDFRQALAVFVRESVGVRPETFHTRIDSSAPSRDPSRDQPGPPGQVPRPVVPLPRHRMTLSDGRINVSTLKLHFHASIRCWKRNGKVADNPLHSELDIARCTPRWSAGDGGPRYDWIWVQDIKANEPEDRPGVPFDGRLPCQLLMVVSVRVPGPRSDSAVHTGVVVRTYEPVRADGDAEPTHGMTIIRPLRRGLHRNRLGPIRIYPLSDVLHSIHVVGINSDIPGNPDDRMYINNYADFETYNMLYNDDWESEEARKAAEAKAKRVAELLARRHAAEANKQRDADSQARHGGTET